jgi:hypothetical protein
MISNYKSSSSQTWIGGLVGFLLSFNDLTCDESLCFVIDQGLVPIHSHIVCKIAIDMGWRTTSKHTN